jgi:futalosine hydrolase
MILVVCAAAAELRGFDPPDGVEVLVTGIGPVEAALATARAIAECGRIPGRRLDAIVNAGIGGAFRGRAEIGETVLVTHETLAELGLESGADHELPAGLRLTRHAEADRGLVSRLALIGLRAARGITVAGVTSSDARAADLARRFGAAVESMEGFSVLRAAAIAGIPAIELRGISNYVGCRATSEWNFARGAGAAVKALESALPQMAAGVADGHFRSGG